MNGGGGRRKRYRTRHRATEEQLEGWKGGYTGERLQVRKRGYRVAVREM